MEGVISCKFVHCADKRLTHRGKYEKPCVTSRTFSAWHILGTDGSGGSGTSQRT